MHRSTAGLSPTTAYSIGPQRVSTTSLPIATRAPPEVAAVRGVINAAPATRIPRAVRNTAFRARMALQ
jgi:hypothetical protein